MKRRVQAFLRASRAIAEEKGKLKHCQVPGCMQWAQHYGMCSRHYQRERRYGDAKERPASRTAWN
jgi:hypothetical protein